MNRFSSVQNRLKKGKTHSVHASILNRRHQILSQLENAIRSPKRNSHRNRPMFETLRGAEKHIEKTLGSTKNMINKKTEALPQLFNSLIKNIYSDKNAAYVIEVETDMPFVGYSFGLKKYAPPMFITEPSNIKKYFKNIGRLLDDCAELYEHLIHFRFEKDSANEDASNKDITKTFQSMGKKPKQLNQFLNKSKNTRRGLLTQAGILDIFVKVFIDTEPDENSDAEEMTDEEKELLEVRDPEFEELAPIGYAHIRVDIVDGIIVSAKTDDEDSVITQIAETNERLKKLYKQELGNASKIKSIPIPDKTNASNQTSPEPEEN